MSEINYVFRLLVLLQKRRLNAIYSQKSKVALNAVDRSSHTVEFTVVVSWVSRRPVALARRSGAHSRLSGGGEASSSSRLITLDTVSQS
jgi:hypothetical protein